MSHQPERKEKNCLNCENIVHGRFCHVCGQENIIPKQGFWSLIKHFVYDIFHFDGKFFDTLKGLLFKPGVVPREYTHGKRMKYLDPIRMYLFTSAVFFLIFFSVEDVTNVIRSSQNLTLTRAERFTEAMEISKELQKKPDSALLYKLNELLDTTKRIDIKIASADYNNDSFLIKTRNKNYYIIPKVDTADFHFINKNNNWFERTMERRWKEKKAMYKDDENKMVADLSSEFMHKMPYLLFISLPFFALILKLLYIRRRKVYYFNDHAIFTLYHYIFVFIVLLIYLFIKSLNRWTGWGIFDIIGIALMVLWPLYLLLGMKNFYQQRWLKTIFKFLMVNVLGFIVLIVLFSIFIVISFIF